tara:strand:+ start:2185 stop:4620 length:2436 start_codon:yes stop_codon:yes gene_type:complete
MKNISYLLGLLLAFSYVSFADEEVKEVPKDSKEVAEGVAEESMDEEVEEDKEPTISEFIEEGEFEVFEGMIDIYYETDEDTYYTIIEEENLSKEFIYFYYIISGAQAGGASGGDMGDSSVLEFRKFKDDIALYKKNTVFNYDDSNNISKSTLTNILESFVGRFEVKIEEEGRYLVNIDKLFLGEMLVGLTPPKEYAEYYSLILGRIDDKKTYISRVKNYPKNTSIEVTYGFFNPSPKGSVDAVPDARYSSIVARHMFVEMPDDNYEPRVADQRIGYFSTKITDLSTYDYFKGKDLINRWRLIKKDPTAEISEPINPIVFWVENSTPEEIKPFVVEAIELWNIAFEKAGFKNAVVAKIQPDDAEWDAGDVQYNVIRWASTPSPRYSGYGPSVANPRTGEMIAADIVQEFNSISYGYRLRKIWGYDEENDPLRQWIVSLTLHEIGHTLGLRHNFKASWLYDASEIHDKNITGNNHIGSVMDYDPINIAPDGVEQGNYFPTEPGPYDIWAITFGYTQGMSDVDRDNLLSQSTRPEYIFGTDDDAMGSPGGNTDPRNKRYDMSSDPITYTVQRLQIIDNKINELPEIFNEPGSTYTELKATFDSLLRDKGRFAESIAIQIGGVYSNRLVIGQESGLTPFAVVPYAEQKRAMKTLNEYLFANDAFKFSPDILKLLQSEKRAASYGNSDDDPKIHDRVLRMQMSALSFILHPRVMKRLTDSSQYGNEYLPDEVLQDIFEGIFVAREIPNTFKMNLQSAYVDGLIGAMSDERYDEISRSAIFNSLLKIRNYSNSSYGNKMVKGHFDYLNWKINNALDN